MSSSTWGHNLIILNWMWLQRDFRSYWNIWLIILGRLTNRINKKGRVKIYSGKLMSRGIGGKNWRISHLIIFIEDLLCAGHHLGPVIQNSALVELTFKLQVHAFKEVLVCWISKGRVFTSLLSGASWPYENVHSPFLPTSSTDSDKLGEQTYSTTKQVLL